MSAAVATVGAVAAADLPADLAVAAKSASQRKVMRLLDRTFYAPYLAAVELSQRHDTGDPERAALFTVSAWDPSIPIPDYAGQDGPDLRERLSTFYTQPANPTDWLRRMPNNPLCNIAITTGFRGPTIHYQGKAYALSLLATVAAGMLESGAAVTATIVAFDVPAGQEHALPNQADAAAAGVLLARGGAGPTAGQLADSAAAAAPGTSALAALEAFVATVGTGR